MSESPKLVYSNDLVCFTLWSWHTQVYSKTLQECYFSQNLKLRFREELTERYVSPLISQQICEDCYWLFEVCLHRAATAGILQAKQKQLE